MSTWGVVDTSPFQDIADYEDLIYKYLGTNWSITSPTHLNKLTLFQTTDPAQMINRPDPGNKQSWLWVGSGRLDTGYELPGALLGKHGHIPHFHTFIFNIMTTRLVYGLTFPDLGIIGREIERLIYQYDKNTIPGIDHFDRFTGESPIEATLLGPQFLAYAGTFIQQYSATAHYWKQRLD
jgi:hypothetical protein